MSTETQFQELFKQAFHGKELRILGSPENPLFVAENVARILGLKVGWIDEIEEYNLFIQHKTDSEGTTRYLTLLNVAGLCSALLKSKKSCAAAFEKWVFEEVLPSIRKVPGREPLVALSMFHINDFEIGPCIYMFHLRDAEYKFAMSGSKINENYKSYMRSFVKAGCDPKLLKIWNCKSMRVMIDTKQHITLVARRVGVRTRKYNNREIISTDNINYLVDRVNKYVAEQNSRENAITENEMNKLRIRKLELKIRELELINECLQLDLKLQKIPSVQNVQPGAACNPKKS